MEEVQDANGMDLFADNIGGASLNGLYAGIGIRSFTNVFIKTEQAGGQFNSAGRLIYIDAIFASTSLPDPCLDQSVMTFNEDEAKEAIGSLPIGFRFGTHFSD